MFAKKKKKLMYNIYGHSKNIFDSNSLEITEILNCLRLFKFGTQ